MLNRSLLIVTPKPPFLDWLHALPDSESPRLTLEKINEDAQVYLLPDAEMADDWDIHAGRGLLDAGGKIRALNGVNNGPFVDGNPPADMNAMHKEAACPSVRQHDGHWPNPNVVDNPLFL